MQLPPANRQRLLWLLSQVLERQLRAGLAHGEEERDDLDPCAVPR
jgi:hypothetical protein